MNLKIAICDDSAVDAEFVKSILTRWADQREMKVLLEVFPSAESFLFCYAEDKSWDILLLDIEMGAMDGVTMAKTIRQNNDSVQIIFITGFPDFAQEGYEVSALHYLMKPVSQDKLFSVLDRAVTNLQKNERVLLLPMDGETVRLPIGEVQYVEAFSHQIAITAKGQTLRVKLPISEMEKMLGAGFVRCHRSYLVGLKHIARISRTEVFLDSGKVLPISRSTAALVHQAFISYYTGETNETV